MNNRAIVLAARPEGMPRDSDFRLEQRPLPRPGAGQVLCRTLYLSLDPYMRGRMSAARSYAPSLELGEVMVGQTVSQVVESGREGFRPGDLVLANAGWQEFSLGDGSDLVRLDPAPTPPSYALGVLGMPGLTAYVGLLDIGRPKPGETVVVSAASGAVGQVVGQLARLQGCRVVGVAGSQAKCDYVVNELGFDACVNYKRDSFPQDLAGACPDGVDVYFENVGGNVFDAVAELLNVGARIPLCGTIASYNASQPASGPDRLPRVMRLLLTRRVMIQGFIIFDHNHRREAFLEDMTQWLREGKVKYREDVVEGLENAPRAFMGLLAGENLGKRLVKVAEPAEGQA